MTAPVPHLQPAHLSHLCLYNPSLGPSEETFADQLVFSYSRISAEAKRKKKRGNDATEAEAEDAEQVRRQEENERLRRIGLAQGMVDFAKSFSQGQPVDSIETEKSRIVLCELETGWWVLASIDLTRLPSITTSHSSSTSESSKKPDKAATPPKHKTEYSSREVSPSALLIAQLRQAHSIFLLHHGPCLSDLFVRLSRDKFCKALDRFWTRFAKTWDVLLHGNPATDIIGGIKLAAGGELGFGVGEEEWGSGERDVLEDLVRRTEGMVDLVVSRFGKPAKAEASDESHLPEHEALPWMGSGSQPLATDGVVFGGVGAITRPGLRQVSNWIRQIYEYGEHAYGVRDNPARERKKRRRRNSPPEQFIEQEEANGHATPPEPARDLSPTDLRQKVQRRAAADTRPPPQAADTEASSVDQAMLPHDPRPSIHDRTASQDHAAKSAADTPPLPPPDKPGIPPPIVSAVDKALEEATKKADRDLKSHSSAEEPNNTTWGVPDQYMKYLTFGLSELGKWNKPQRPAAPKRDSSATIGSMRKARTEQGTPAAAASETLVPLTHLDPTPDGEYASNRFSQQRRQENRGHFLIGLKGNLDELPDTEADAAAMTDGSFYNNDDAGGPRTVLRTLQVECHVVPPAADKRTVSSQETLPDALARTAGKAEADAAPRTEVKRLRVLIYIHRPFIYCFLFETRTSSLSYASFYKSLHQTLNPIYKPLLSSTSVQKVAQRIEASHAEAGADTASVLSSGTGPSGRRTSTGGLSNRLPHKSGLSASEPRPIYDLLYDPRLETVHTSLPNIPEPGTAGAEGLGGQAAGWTRVDALGVHSQVLGTLQAISKSRGEYERTCKTARGWWVVGMRCPASLPGGREEEEEEVERRRGSGKGEESPRANSAATLRPSEGPDTTVTTHVPSLNAQAPPDMSRIAFLVRKSSDTSSSKSASGSSSTAGGGRREASSSLWANLALRPMLGLGPTEEEKTGGAAEGWGPPVKGGGGVEGLGAGMGIGVDVRRYVEGLFSLNR